MSASKSAEGTTKFVTIEDPAKHCFINECTLLITVQKIGGFFQKNLAFSEYMNFM
jgi:hypothetical protein